MKILRAEPILNTVKQIDNAETADAAIKGLMEFARPLGFDRFLISQLINPYSAAGRNLMQHTDWPEDIIEDRFKKGNVYKDPIVRYGIRSRHPFSWMQAYAFEARYGTTMEQTARDYSMNDGFMFPMRRPGSIDGGISLAAEKIDISRDEIAEMQLACAHCYFRLDDLHNGPNDRLEKVKLSQQEIDVLQFAAAGKTFWEMSKIMNVSEAAAKDATRRARRKLNAVNTTHAVSTAIAKDLILP